VTIWNTPLEFKQAFPKEYRNYILADVFHRIKAHLLYPLNCGCRSKNPCSCEDLRARVILTLNIGLYNQVEDHQDDQRLLSSLRYFLQIPDDRFLRRNLKKIHAPDFIEGELRKKVDAKHFQIVDELVWTLLRLAATNEAFGLYGPHTSLNEAIGIILGKVPLKSALKKLTQKDYLCGEKGFITHFKTYKAVCHFIMAFKFIDPVRRHPCFTLTKPSQIEKFLKVSHKLRRMLLILETPNSKEKNLFTPTSLIPLPDWVGSDDIHITVEPLEDKLRYLKDQLSAAIAASESH
jgi:hypothetical protein